MTLKSNLVFEIVKEGKDSFYKEVFDQEWNKCQTPSTRRKQWKKCVSDIINDMDLTSLSVCSKEALSYINNALKILSQVGCILKCVRIN